MVWRIKRCCRQKFKIPGIPGSWIGWNVVVMHSCACGALQTSLNFEQLVLYKVRGRKQ